LTDWYRITSDEALAQTGTSSLAGLSPEEAARRLAEYGPNELAEADRLRVPR
jgi:Ca2+-transporting ATPase